MWREETSSGDGLVMTRTSTRTLEDIYMGREGMRSVIISNQDVIDLVLDFSRPPSPSLSLPPAPGSCHSGTLRLNSSSETDCYTSLSLCLTSIHKLSLCICPLVTGSNVKLTQMFVALLCIQSLLAAHLHPQYPHKCTQTEAVWVLRLPNVTSDFMSSLYLFHYFNLTERFWCHLA